MEENHFNGRIGYPTHLSVGAVLINERNEVCCHYFKELRYPSIAETLFNFYILMRESLELGETLEEAMARGLREEFGATGEILTYLGPIVAKNLRFDSSLFSEKTTLYFLVRCIGIDPTTRDPNDLEAVSEVVWKPADQLIPLMEAQQHRFDREDVNESEMLRRAQKYLHKPDTF